MNFLLYSNYIYEMLMVSASFLAALLPVILVLGLIFTQKPEFTRALIIYLASKTVLLLQSEFAYSFGSEKVYVCVEKGVLVEQLGMPEHCFLVSAFFTYVVLSTLMSMNNYLCSNIVMRMNFSFYAMTIGIGFLFVLYLSKLHLLLGSQTVILTSIELGMGFAVVFLLLMVAGNMWPIRMSSCLDSLPEEDLLLTHLCMKWNIDTNISKLEKMT